jgi:TRAP-type transport system small permease protein
MIDTSKESGVSRLVEASFRLVEGVLATLLAAMVIMVFGNVVLRYLFNSGIVVSEELSRFCFVWLTFIGAVVAARDGTHLGMDNVVSRLSRRGKLACLAASQVLILICCVLLLVGTWRQHAINATTTAPVTGLRLSWLFDLGYIVGGGIGALAVRDLWRIASGRIRDDELVQVQESEEPVAGVRP